MNKQTVAVLAAFTLASLAAPLTVQAQSVPSYAQPQYSQDWQGDAQIRGRVTGFDGAYSLSVRDERGFIDAVELHPGTVINPTGLTLAPGMIVSVLGYNAGSYFAANEIDTPYSYYGGVPYYYGHPWSYYGPSISLGFFFGNPGWWHGGYFHGGYAWNSGVRVYQNVRINNIYRGGSYQGRTYVAPVAHGGYYRGASAVRVQSHVWGGYQSSGGHSGDHGGYGGHDRH